ncbi:MAG TPA: CHAT domain-containing protein [Gemmatimonadaceae bacterium]|nr:CHAT domain-containing protein [Gemmatimonadaceae bacterium]
MAGEVLGGGIAKRSVLYLDDGTPMSDLLFASSALGRNTKSFLFMNACQVGVGGEELGMYAGFAGMAISAGFSGFIGPLWSVNDQVAKQIAIDFYRRSFGTDGKPPRPVADVLADMRSSYMSEPDPKRRQSTWLAYVHYGHPHFTLAHS